MDLQAVISETQEGRVEALRQILDYPLKQRDPEGSRFYFCDLVLIKTKQKTPARSPLASPLSWMD